MILCPLQVTIQYPAKEATRYVKEDLHRTLARAICEGSNPDKIAGIVYRHEPSRERLHKLMLHKLSQDCTRVCSDRFSSELQKKSTNDLQDIDWDKIIHEWKTASKLLYEVLEAIASKVKLETKKQHNASSSRHDSAIVVAGSVLLYHRNPKMCRIQMANGLILDQGGATDEVCISIDLMDKLLVHCIYCLKYS